MFFAISPVHCCNIRATKEEFINNIHRRTSLKAFDLSNNDINRIESGSFNDLRSLLSLNFENNSLTKIDGTVLKGLTSLKELNMKSNKIASFESDSLNGFNNFTQLCLFNNPIQVNSLNNVCNSIQNCAININRNCAMSY